MKKTLALLTATGMALTMLAGCGGGSSSTADSSEAASSEAVSSEAASSEAAPAAEEGQILNIWCWNDEFQSRFNDYYPGVK